jgi:uncharacterized protein YjbJ (UPF0337 family)
MLKTLPWIAAAAGIATAAYFLANRPAPQHATGSDQLEGAARKTADWGSKQRLASPASKIAGKVKEGFGRATGNADLANEGAFDQLAGAAKDTVGEVAQAAGQTLHDLNR